MGRRRSRDDSTSTIHISESKSLYLRRESFSILEQIQETVADVQNRHYNQNSRDGSAIRFILRYDDAKRFVVYADKTRISQVIVNLLDNAVKFIGSRDPNRLI